MNERTSSDAGANLEKYVLKQTVPQELDKVLSIKFYAEVTTRNRDTNELESIKIMQSAIERYLKEKILHSWASCSWSSFTTQMKSIAELPHRLHPQIHEMSQPQPQKKGRSIQTPRIELWSMKETVFSVFSFSLQHLNCLFVCYAWTSFRHMTSFCILNEDVKAFLVPLFLTNRLGLEEYTKI